MNTDRLIVGAGPFGLALAAQAQHDRIEHLVVGKPMEFWRANMPKGMFLRSACDWHLDPQNVHTIEAYLHSQNKTPADVEPISLACRIWLPETCSSNSKRVMDSRSLTIT